MGKRNKVYLNSIKFLKIGKNIWTLLIWEIKFLFFYAIYFDHSFMLPTPFRSFMALFTKIQKTIKRKKLDSYSAYAHV